MAHEIPEIRFAGFAAPWERRKWMETVEISTEMVNPASGKYDNMPHIAPGNIESFTGRILNNVKTVKEEQLISGKFRFRPGDVVYGKINPQLGKYFYADLDGLTSADAYVLKGKNGITQKFLFSLLQTEDFFKYSVSVSKRSGMPKINRDELNAYSFWAPCEEEQIQIGTFLLGIDRLITILQRKVEKPQDGARVPEIRFSGFTGDWERRKLLACIQKITDFRGRTPKKLGMDWSESGYLALSALNVKDGYIDFSQDVHYGSQALYDKWMSGSELHKGQVLFTTEAPMGNVAQVPDDKRYILSQRTIAFDVKENIITENFLATLLRSPAVFNTLTSLCSGGTAQGVSQRALASVVVQIPKDLKEQALIADYFHNFDRLITLYQRKVEKLQQFKKAMLAKMFA